jgi:beta-lactamase superfamily II metal-dependent hydrolase
LAKKATATSKTATRKRAPKKKKAGAEGALNDRQITIRMYNVGFGDAFLVLLPDGDRQRRILFDCGSIEAATGVTMPSVVDRIVRDVTDADGIPRVDVVVATHRHKDHVSGFGQAAWDKVEVKEVWMPWTEHPTDNEARRIRDIQSRLALGLQAALTTKAAALGGAQQKELSRYQDLVANALMLSNDKAMKTLHSGFTGNPQRRFLPAKTNDNRTLETDALPGVKVHVLGPSRNPDVIRDMNPPKGESFLRLAGAISSQTGLSPAPFSAEFVQAVYTGTGTLQGDDLQEIQRAGSLSDLAVAVALDKAVNGTSLMLVLEVSGTFLLFPGDAQWGTWSVVMEDPEWKEMLARVAFYKIGHHGSHNATPRDFVEKIIPEGICAMASTLVRQVWPDIPRGPLLDGLTAKKARIARSDQPNNIDETFRVDNQNVIETLIAL